MYKCKLHAPDSVSSPFYVQSGSCSTWSCRSWHNRPNFYVKFVKWLQHVQQSALPTAAPGIGTRGNEVLCYTISEDSLINLISAHETFPSVTVRDPPRIPFNNLTEVEQIVSAEASVSRLRAVNRLWPANTFTLCQWDKKSNRSWWQSHRSLLIPAFVYLTLSPHTVFELLKASFSARLLIKITLDRTFCISYSISSDHF
jgi:hypothetical protein